MKMSTFQLIFTAIFVGFILLGVLAFSLFTAKNNSIGNVTIWGTADGGTMTELINTLSQQDKSFQSVTYLQRPSATFNADVINAMASGAGPDLVLLAQDQLQTFSGKILTIPYSTVSQSDFTSSYIEEAQLFLTADGSVALPFLINPMVMYWNRDLFSTAGLPQPPKFWDDLLTTSQRLTVLDASNNIKKSAIAMGSWDNVAYAKQLLTALFMQAGDGITAYNQQGVLTSVFGQTPTGAPENPASSALQFYTEFANPSKVTYSWNRSLKKSTDAFVAGDLALYAGFASDYPTLSARNPNLRFGVAMLPQIKGSSTHLTFGQLSGLAIPRTAANVNGALLIAEKLSSQVGVAAASQAFGLPPVRTDVAVDTSASAATTVFYQSALISRGWVDPDYAGSDAIFRDMVESVISNKSLPDAAVQEASQSLQALIPRQ
jgi:ABC-type glycerol-3-phosphate transport system substrate-binding protein